MTPVQYTAECGCITVLIPVTPVQYCAVWLYHSFVTSDHVCSILLCVAYHSFPTSDPMCRTLLIVAVSQSLPHSQHCAAIGQFCFDPVTVFCWGCCRFPAHWRSTWHWWKRWKALPSVCAAWPSCCATSQPPRTKLSSTSTRCLHLPMLLGTDMKMCTCM